jgi:hypothetical protein
MKPITLHPFSVLAGFVLAAVLSLVSGAAQTAGPHRPVPVDQQIIGHIPASWWTSVYVDSDSPTHQTYTVPTDKYLVVTVAAVSATLLVNGQVSDLDFSVVNMASSNPYWFETAGTRIVIPPGSVLTESPTYGGSIRLWGYLEPVR